jgi:hypothetical protein
METSLHGHVCLQRRIPAYLVVQVTGLPLGLTTPPLHVSKLQASAHRDKKQKFR